jgi:uncharacterized protein (DUF1015 family)
MADARPFRAWRYAGETKTLGSLLCPPYDVISPERGTLLRKGRRNAIHLELPAGEGAARYKTASTTWRKWRADGTLARDPRPAYYLVEERFTRDGRHYVRRGFLAGLGATPKASKQVIPHERTLSKPKADRLRMLGALNANISPIFGVFADADKSVYTLLAKLAKGAPVLSTKTPEGVAYRLFRVDEPKIVASLQKALKPRDVLIADGHHRYSVSQEYWKRTHKFEAEAVLCYLVPDSDPGLVVLPTHRITESRLLDRAGQLAALTPQKNLASLVKALNSSKNPYAFGLVEGDLNLLGLPKGSGGCRSGLCVEWVGRHLLAEIAPDQLKYTPDAADAAKRVGDGAAVLIKSFPVAQVSKAAKAVGLLPQKSTYFVPKITTGLAFRELKA